MLGKWQLLHPALTRAATTRLFSPSNAESSMHAVTTVSEAVLAAQVNAITAEADGWAGCQRTIGVPLDEQYMIREVLGEGSFGVVHRVLRKSDGVELAAKSISRLSSDDKRAEEEWASALSEASSWSQISSPKHPSILPLIEIMQLENAVHLITQLMPCAELTDAVFSLQMSEQAARLITVQIAAGVAHLHLHHMMAHRDVKPENVLCASADPTAIGCLKLADFGLLAKFETRSQPCWDMGVGTLDYFAPELAENFEAIRSGHADPPRYGAAVDCWAVGCIAYEMLHGQPPYYTIGETDEQVLANIRRHELPLPSSSFEHVSPTGLSFLRALLEPDPAKRLAIESALAHPWLQPVADESLRVKMAAELKQEVAERRADRARRQMRGAGLKVIASQRLSNPPPRDPPKSVGFAQTAGDSRQPPPALARAPSSVRPGDGAPASGLERDGARAAISFSKRSARGAKGSHAGPAADPMLHYARVYRSSADLLAGDSLTA